MGNDGSPNNMPSPFKSAVAMNKRLKLFLWGDCGVGKTTLALQFPRPVVIDMEGGTDLYGDAFEFDVLRVTEADEITAAVDWLLHNPHSYRTLVTDPITMFWESLQRKWSAIFLKRNRGQKGHHFEFYDMGPREWMTVKSEWKEFLRKLIRLDMNVVATARAKPQYADSGFMRKIGETFDAERSTHYIFDTVLRLFRDEKGVFMAECQKDRSNKLTSGEFEISYPILEQHFGRETLVREARPLALASPDQITTLRQLIVDSGMSDAMLVKRLATYGVDRPEALTEENAAVIIQKLEAAVSTNAGPSNKEHDHAED